MASSHLAEFQTNWQRRFADLQARGVPSEKLQPLYQEDLRRVQGGAQPWSGQEATASISAALTGHPVTSAPGKKHGLGGLLSNIPSDAAGIFKGMTHQLVAQPAAAAAHLAHGDTSGAWQALKEGWTPQTAAATGLDVLGGLAAATGVGAAATPFLEAAGAGLMAQQGAEQVRKTGLTGVEEHPIGTLLAFLPAAKVGAKGAAAAAELANPALKDTVAAKAPGIAEAKAGAARPADDLTPGESTYAAAKAGQPVRAAYRAALGGVAQVAPDLPEIVKNRADLFMRKLHIDEYTRDLSRANAVKKREVGTAHARLMDDVKQYLQADPERERGLYEAVTRPDLHPPATLDTETAALVSQVRDQVRRLADTGAARGELHPLTIGDKTVHYATTGREGEVVRAHAVAEKAQGDLAAKRARYAASKERVDATIAERVAKREATETRLREKVKATTDKLRLYEGKDTPYAARMRAKWEEQLNRDAAKLAEHKAKGDPALDDPKHYRAARALTKAKAAATAANKAFLKKLIDTAPAEFHPMLEDQLRQRARAALGDKGVVTEAALDEAMTRLGTEGGWEEYFSKKEWGRLNREVRRGWIGLVGAGYDPVWIHTVPVTKGDAIFNTKVLDDSYRTPSQVRTKVFDLTPRYQSVAVGLTAAGTERLTQAAIADMIDGHLVPTLRTAEQVREELRPQLERALKRRAKTGADPLLDDNAIFVRLRDEHYRKFDPEKYGIKSNQLLKPVDDNLYMPAHVNDAFEAVTGSSAPRNAVVRTSGRVTGMMKTSITFLSPRHFSHAVFGGAMAMLLTGGFDELGSFMEARQRLKDGEIPAGIPLGMDRMSFDEAFHFKAGSKAAELLMKYPDKVAHFEETAGNLYRMMSYLGELKRASRSGYSAEMAETMALEQARKVGVDLDGMTPLENSVLRQVLPFYAFSKYLARFLLHYPADHPIRAAVLTQLSENEQAHWKSGLPQNWQQLFFLGAPDAHGNIKASEVKSLNPFRDAANMLTLTGFYSGLNPLLKLPLEAVGVNTISGTPDLYPGLTYNEATGTLEAARRPIGIRALETILPPAGGLDEMFGLTAQMRSLRASDPQAARRALFTSLGIPFVPQTYNVTTEMAKTERSRYTLAQGVVSTALKTGNTAQLRRLGEVPWRSPGAKHTAMVSGAALADLIERIHKAYPKVAPNDVMPYLTSGRVRA